MSETQASTIKSLSEEEIEIQARNQILLEEQKIKQRALLEKEKNNYKSLKFHEKFVGLVKVLMTVIEDYYQFEIEERKNIPVRSNLNKFYDSYMRTVNKHGHSRGFFSYFFTIFVNHRREIMNISSNRWLKDGDIVIQLGEGKEGIDVSNFKDIKIELSKIFNLALELATRESDEKTMNTRKAHPEIIRLYLANIFYFVTFDKDEDCETDARIFLKALENLCRISPEKSLIDKEPWKPKPSNFNLSNFINSESIDMLTETIGAITGNNIPEDEANKIKSVFEKIFSGNQGNDIMGSIGKQLNQSSTNGQMNNPGDILKNVLGNGELIKSLSNIRQVVDNSVEEVTKKDENNLQAAQAAAQSTNLR